MKVVNLRELWKAACRAQGVPEDTMFIEFDESLPEVQAYNAAATKAARIVREGHTIAHNTELTETEDIS